MKAILILLTALLYTTALLSQVQIQWQKCLGGTGYDQANAIQQTTDGGYIVAGWTQSINGDVSGNHGGEDFWVVKLDMTGNIQWQKCLGGTGYDRAHSIQQTTDGGYIVAGHTNSNNGDVSGNNGYYDMWVVKLDYQGNILWQKCLGGTGYDRAHSIQQTTDGGYIVAGYTYSNNGDVSGNHGDSDMWVVKLDPQGNIQWQKCLGGTNWEEVWSVRQTTDGGYIVAGSTCSNDGDVSGNNGGSDMWEVKLDHQGNIQWQKCLGGTSDDYAYSIQQTTDGGYIVAGYTRSNDGDVSGYNGGYSDMWVVKLDPHGDLLWQKCIGGTDWDEARYIEQIQDGGYLVAGLSVIIGNQYDFFVVKLDILGNLQWQKHIGGTTWDWAYSIKQTTDRGFIVAGWTNSINGDIIGNNGSEDMWVVKLIEPNISGRVFHDINENGMLDSGEQGAAGQMVKLEPGPIYTFTDNEGMYYFRADTGSHTISYVPYSYWYATGVELYDINLSQNQTIGTLHFGIKSRIDVNDLAGYISVAIASVGFQTHYWLTCKNWGTVTASGTVNFEYDPLLTFITSTVAPASHTGNTLVFDYDTLGPGVHRTIRADFQVPGIQHFGDTLHSNAWITPLVPDTNIENNYDTIVHVIVGSYDPNDKTVSPAGYEQWGFVEHGQRLTYTIRFQNTGTYTAFTVVIRDTISSNLDLGTILFEAWSHNVIWEMHNDNEIYFIFNNILLPDSNVNEPESHGFIRYSISPKQGLADGTTATNTSYIFFDYNPAIVTNTTINTFVTNMPVAKPIMEVLKTLVFPNPSNDVVYINLPEFTRKVEVYNINGELVQQLVPQKQVAEINAKELAKGVYVVKIYSGKGVITTRFVKE
jgi:uncharacterized repeat protein (TIGR01451 family)